MAGSTSKVAGGLSSRKWQAAQSSAGIVMWGV
jgi:hypothetical protein